VKKKDKGGRVLLRLEATRCIFPSRLPPCDPTLPPPSLKTGVLLKDEVKELASPPSSESDDDALYLQVSQLCVQPQCTLHKVSLAFGFMRVNVWIPYDASSLACAAHTHLLSLQVRHTMLQTYKWAPKCTPVYACSSTCIVRSQFSSGCTQNSYKFIWILQY